MAVAFQPKSVEEGRDDGTVALRGKGMVVVVERKPQVQRYLCKRDDDQDNNSVHFDVRCFRVAFRLLEEYYRDRTLVDSLDL